MSIRIRVNPPEGSHEPGDCWPLIRRRDDGQHGCDCPYWDNCVGGHYMIVAPNGQSFSTGNRASNCTKPTERTHRCWVQHGTAETGDLTFDKNGNTCEAGAGSWVIDGYTKPDGVVIPTWHGFIRNGEME